MIQRLIWFFNSKKKKEKQTILNQMFLKNPQQCKNVFEFQIDAHKSQDRLSIPNIERFDFKIDNILKQQYINAHEGCGKKYVKLLLDNTRYISFTTFKKTVESQIDRLIKYRVPKDAKKTVNLIVSSSEDQITKSNYWVAQLVYEKLRHLSNLEIIIYPNLRYINNKNECIFCDDASFSGTQLDGYISILVNHNQQLDNNKPIHIIIPYISSQALNKLIRYESLSLIHI